MSLLNSIFQNTKRIIEYQLNYTLKTEVVAKLNKILEEYHESDEMFMTTWISAYIKELGGKK